MSEYTFEEPGSPNVDLDDHVSRAVDVSVLDQLKSTLQKKVQRPTIEIDIPEREGVSVRFSPNISHHDIKMWRNKAGVNSKDGMDGLKFACYIVGSTCTGILMGGELVEEHGSPLTFASKTILDSVGALRPIPDGIRAFFGVDPHVENVAGTILEKAGWGEEVEETDPTKES